MLTKKEKRWLLLGKFTDLLIEYEKHHLTYTSLLLRLGNIRPTSVHFYIDTSQKIRTVKKRDNFEIIEELMKSVEKTLSKLESIDKEIISASKEYQLEFKEMIPIESIRFNNKSLEEEFKKKLEVLLNGKKYC